jgi:acyl dehydratase
MPKLYWKSIEIGDPIPPMAQAILTRSSMVSYAVYANETSPLHLDEEFARQAGYGSVSAPGLLGMSYVTEMIERWAENGRLTAIGTRFQKLMWPGDALTAKGVVVRKFEQAKQFFVDCDVWIQNQANDTVIKGTATCVLFYDQADERKRRGKLDDVKLVSPANIKPVTVEVENNAEAAPVEVANDTRKKTVRASQRKVKRRTKHRKTVKNQRIVPSRQPNL